MAAETPGLLANDGHHGAAATTATTPRDPIRRSRASFAASTLGALHPRGCFEFCTSRARHRIPRPIDTVRDFLRAVASLGGFLGRKFDGEPGWITIWRGLETLLVALLYHVAAVFAE